jgi:hypothetical protein
VKALGWLVFTALVAMFTATIVIAIYATVNDVEQDPPDVAARKAECRKVIRHLIEISPGTHDVEEANKKVPIEDVEMCGAAYPESVGCMATAKDAAAVKACMPEQVEADDNDVDVKGDHPVFEVTGKGKTVKVAANHARVIIKGEVQAVDIAGSDNKIEYKPPENGKPAPQVADHGTGNSVKPIEKKD